MIRETVNWETENMGRQTRVIFLSLTGMLVVSVAFVVVISVFFGICTAATQKLCQVNNANAAGPAGSTQR